MCGSLVGEVFDMMDYGVWIDDVDGLIQYRVKKIIYWVLVIDGFQWVFIFIDNEEIVCLVRKVGQIVLLLVINKSQYFLKDGVYNFYFDLVVWCFYRQGFLVVLVFDCLWKFQIVDSWKGCYLLYMEYECKVWVYDV